MQFQLREVALVSVWNEGVFGLSEGTLEGLVRVLDTFDFAVLVITPDDVIWSRETRAQAPRDNVMFELGLFMGRLGPARTFVVCSDAPDLKLPSDLAGVTTARFNAADAVEHLEAALGPCAFLIRQAIKRLGRSGGKKHAQAAVSLLERGKPIDVGYRYSSRAKTPSKGVWRTTWKHLFEAMAPYMVTPNQKWSLEEQLRSEIMDMLREEAVKPGEDYDFRLSEATSNEIKVRFLALGLIEVGQTEHGHETWVLSEAGRALLVALDEERQRTEHPELGSRRVSSPPSERTGDSRHKGRRLTKS
jgi:hypothetical protein